MASEPHVDVDEVVALSKVQTIDEKHDIKQAYSHDSTDEVIDASLLPTEEEIHTLRRVSDSIPMVAWTIVFVEFAERFSWYGTTGPMTNYIQQPLPRGSVAGNVIYGGNEVAGALGRGQRTSTALANFRQFWTYFTPIIGAIVADTYFGRFKAIVVFFSICLVGHILLVFVSIPSAIQNPNGALGGFIISLVIMGLGTGGFKSNISPLVAEQYRGKLHKRTLPSGETVIVDPTLTVQRTFLYFYMMINCGSLLSLTTTFAEKHVGFWLAYALPTFVFMLIPPVLVWGNKHYHKTPPRGSILLESWRVFRLAARGKWSLNPVTVYRNFSHPDFWQTAKPSYYQGKGGESAAGAGAIPAAITWDDEFADEVMRALKACKVFAFFPLYWISYDQMTSNLTSQAATMVLNGVPNEIVNNLNPLSLVIMIPIMERVVYPGLRRMKINFTPIKRITFGFFLASMAMVYTTVIQYYIYKKGPCGKFASDCDEPAPLNVWLQAPSYIIIGLSEIFASITGLEYAFTKAPERMKSVVTSVFLFMSALASAIEFGLVGVSTDPYLMWMYAGVAITSFIAGIVFWFTFRGLDKEEDALNIIGATGRSGFKDEAK